MEKANGNTRLDGVFLCQAHHFGAFIRTHASFDRCLGCARFLRSLFTQLQYSYCVATGGVF